MTGPYPLHEVVAYVAIAWGLGLVTGGLVVIAWRLGWRLGELRW